MLSSKQSDDAHRAVSSFAWTMVLSRAIYLKVTARVVLMMATALVIHCNGGGEGGNGGDSYDEYDKSKLNDKIK